MRKLQLIPLVFLVSFGLAKADQLAEIKARGTLVCGVYTGAEPFAFQDPASRELRGYDIDFCKGIAARLGVKPQLKVVSLEARIPELQQKRVDVLAALLGYNAARAEQVTFSDAYYVSRQIVSVKTDNVKALSEMAGKRLSTIKGSSNIPMIQRSLPTATIVSYEDGPAAFMAMMQNKVDGFAVSETAFWRFLQKMKLQSSTLHSLEPAVGAEYIGMGIRKGEPALEAAINNALLDMEKSGEVDKIFDQWIKPAAPTPIKRSFTIAPIPR
ncbi:amino acid transport system, exported protein [Burkholderia lata]|uniref:Amino acid transport system, exported protein n=1 Tax=Burkholderia lata (strain ATCC 17760 / DSM 23089 / LMG 22485 / NCIMB 9086 / R18194 / 383) TaxID=482957 RepID=A0A6P2VAS5_BURL3|nr:transporter substrate-binding domain-containing protein [Burkholderia lata]VWC76343.1 amino acid transport system, exported protein [Burkholderia lata]